MAAAAELALAGAAASLAPPRLVAAAAQGHLPGWCLFVYNLAPDTEEGQVWRLFGPLGAVQQVNLAREPSTNKCRGFAFVTMSDYAQALAAIQTLNGHTLANRVLQVSFKTPPTKSQLLRKPNN